MRSDGSDQRRLRGTPGMRERLLPRVAAVAGAKSYHRSMDPRIVELLRDAPLIDGHNDLLWALREAREDGRRARRRRGCRRSSRRTCLAWRRAGSARSSGPCTSPRTCRPIRPSPRRSSRSRRSTALIHRYPGRLEQARTASDVRRIAAKGRVASMIGVEGGHSIGNSLGHPAHPRAPRRRLHDAHPQRRHRLGGLGHGRASARRPHHVRRGGRPRAEPLRRAWSISATSPTTRCDRRSR